MEEARERAVNGLRYGAGIGLRAYPLNPPQLSNEELATMEAEQRAYQRNYARREALSHTLALGRRYDSAQDAIADAKVIAAWIGLEIE